ncbi:uncharacterized protein LOC123879362 isoform X2 [Maniola jurtina]|uniref:uncharacterized protein LOC123879362 isoform X2 n=1 Tax=Maniola jurtina TaxID=191418 RepID=UPI001E68767E|nr:uncharacterized protein LOC123879362 isoform X2 [Maniola jurtina]
MFSASTLFYTEANFLHSNEAINKNTNNRNELINIIQSLNSLNDNLESNNEEYKKMLRNAKELTDMEKEQKLQEILWLIKTNYDAQKLYDLIQNPVHSGTRLYFIKNPKAIDEYKKYLERKKIRNPRKPNIKNKLQDLRRKVMFRIGGESYEEHITERKLPVDSMEIHDKKLHASGISNSDLRREKSDLGIRDEREIEKTRNWYKKVDQYDKIHKITSEKKLAISKYKNYDNNFDNNNGKFEINRLNSKEKENRWKKTYDFVKTTKFTTEFKRKNLNDGPFKPKIRFKNPKGDRNRNDYSVYARTPIPYVKRGVYEDEYK